MDKQRFKPFAAVFLILRDGDKILLHKRKNTGYMDGCFSLVSGHLEGAESARQALIREAEEEVGVIIQEKELNLVHTLHRYRIEREYIDLFFECKTWEAEAKNMELNKCEMIDWFQKNRLPENIIPEIKQVLEDIKLGKIYGEHGW